MTPEEELVQLLTQDARVMALINFQDPAATAAPPYIEPMKISEESGFPAISYQRISAPSMSPSQTDPGPLQPRIRIKCWARSYDKAVALASAAIAALDYRRGVVGQSMTRTADHDERDAETGLYGRVFEILVATT